MKINRWLGYTLIVLLPLLVLAGCAGRQQSRTGAGPERGAGEADQARLRVIHGSPDAPAVDVYVDGNEVLSGLEPGEGSAFQNVSAGQHTVTVYPAGKTDNPVLEKQVDLNQWEDYTVVAAGPADNLQVVIAGNKAAEPSQDEAMVQFIHAAAGAPAVDVRVPKENTLLFSDVSFDTSTDYKSVPGGSYTLVVTPAGKSDQTLLRVPDVRLQDGKAYTIVAQNASGGQPVTAKIYEDQ